jgi:hypothetical protein
MRRVEIDTTPEDDNQNGSQATAAEELILACALAAWHHASCHLCVVS